MRASHYGILDRSSMHFASLLVVRQFLMLPQDCEQGFSLNIAAVKSHTTGFEEVRNCLLAGMQQQDYIQVQGDCICIGSDLLMDVIR